jgi:hypothetical protein
VCPADGWYMVQTGDVSQGYPCTPGQPVNLATLTASNGGAQGSSAGGGTSGGGDTGSAGGGLAGKKTAPALNSCILQSFDKNNNLSFTNDCSVKVNLLFYLTATQYGGEHPVPGEMVTDYYTSEQVQAAGGVILHACPDGYYPSDANGHFAAGSARNFWCVQQ